MEIRARESLESFSQKFNCLTANVGAHTFKTIQFFVQKIPHFLKIPGAFPRQCGNSPKKKRSPGQPGRSIRREKNVLVKNKFRKKGNQGSAYASQKRFSVFKSAPHFEWLPRFL
ncbi:hypothetical protein CH380_03535 [Leptospira adleri]|uniref:Uncharacterized protein n=1 Tax=Leptospira adleri TaxID=2023186 RepID=A0A2M9YTC1_9LEPT|nr:hypothetical protein CH380_03535 [Leptospira adleri]PJZ61458.1 hypothetical protein CH376_13260 [Leptospira adleri]